MGLPRPLTLNKEPSSITLVARKRLGTLQQSVTAQTVQLPAQQADLHGVGQELSHQTASLSQLLAALSPQMAALTFKLGHSASQFTGPTPFFPGSSSSAGPPNLALGCADTGEASLPELLSQAGYSSEACRANSSTIRSESSSSRRSPSPRHDYRDSDVFRPEEPQSPDFAEPRYSRPEGRYSGDDCGRRPSQRPTCGTYQQSNRGHAYQQSCNNDFPHNRAGFQPNLHAPFLSFFYPRFVLFGVPVAQEGRV